MTTRHKLAPLCVALAVAASACGKGSDATAAAEAAPAPPKRDRVSEDWARRENLATQRPAPPPPLKPNPPGPTFYPPEWTGTDFNSLQAAAIYFYQNPAAIDEPFNATMLIGLYNCKAADESILNEVRKAMYLERYKAALRMWLAQAKPQASFEVTMTLGQYNATAGRFNWYRLNSPVANLAVISTDMNLNCGLSQLHSPQLWFTQPQTITSPAFTPVQADPFITKNVLRKLTLRVFATVPKTSRYDNSPIARGETKMAITVDRVEIVQP